MQSHQILLRSLLVSLRNSSGSCSFSGMHKWLIRIYEIQPTQTVRRRQHHLQNYQIPKRLWYFLQEDLDAAARWESDWLMTFHPDKCSVLTITNKNNPVKHNYLLHNHTLESVSSAKYLGITLQSDLKWTQHANNIVANANKVLDSWKETLKPPTQI